ncbi:MAG TPA: TldD/PmbA family protein [Candidatus Hydrogenedentes bacterium]|nr:TldD/PmbA family protein [Candidatus Hydrogenedentota bacterium]HIJ72778.1 TldD/PmbA family protein [Candidatus Hydrogenedentota bacterium]
MDDLLLLAQKACDAAVKAGAEFVDVSAYRGRSLSVALEKCAVKSCDAHWNAGVSVRAFVRGARGWASASGLDETEALNAARNATKLATVAEPDPDFASLPEKAAYPTVEGLYDSRLAELEADELVQWAGGNIDAAREVDPEVLVSGAVRTGWSEGALANNLGVEAASHMTYVNMYVMALVKHGDDVGSYFDYDVGRVLDDFDPAGLGAKAAQEARRFLGARKIETSHMPVVLGPLAAHSTLGMVCWSANAEEVQRNRSWLAGKKGRQVASELLTLVDDPLIPQGCNSSAFDGEGFPRKPLTVVENGVLMSWLHDSYTANKANEPNTGHSTRGGIRPTNVNPKLGDLTAEQIIRDTKEGLYVPSGSLSANEVSGDVSSSVDFGFKIENGAIAYPVKNTMIAGNMLEFLRNLDAISSDYREEPGTVMPTIRIQNVRVAGGK